MSAKSGPRRGGSGHPDIDCQIEDGVALMRLDRPNKLNALTDSMLAAIAAWVSAVGDDDRCVGIVVTGAGRAFSAGHDLDRVDTGAPFSPAAAESFHELTRVVLASRVPAVAALNGIAVGGAAEWTLCFDASLGCAETEFLFPENRLGLTVTNGASVLLPRLLGARALSVVLDAPRLGAAEALELGLLDEVHPREKLLDAARERVSRWGARPSSTAQHLRLLRPRPEELEAAMARETAASEEAWRSGATGTGVAAFREASA